MFHLGNLGSEHLGIFCSGAREDANDPIDVLAGDWMSEGNMTGRANAKLNGQFDAYEPTFPEALEPALPHIAKYRIKVAVNNPTSSHVIMPQGRPRNVAVNAGASDTQKLHQVVTKMGQSKGLNLGVAWISGDEVLPQLLDAQKARCAFEKGADIVVCGRWHNWQRSDSDKLYNTFVVGYIPECSYYSTGGNNTGFKDFHALRGGKGALPPPITKVGITAKPLYQAEMHLFLTGLDIPAKARMIEQQIRAQMAPHDRVQRTLRIKTLQLSTLASIAQARKVENLAPAKFFRPCIDSIVCACPGATPHLDLRQAFPKEIFEYYVTLLPQSAIAHQGHLATGEAIDIPPPIDTKMWTMHQPIQEFTSNIPRSDCNVGFWVRYQDKYAWLQNLFSVDLIKQMYADEYKGGRVERCEFPCALLLKDQLDRGVSCTTSVDFQGKNCAESLRVRVVDMSSRFIARADLGLLLSC
ncbi:uncharacterized protein K460DRAFT_375570 [Cucurbitaria berberidis CBS 394.84]|uniref:Acyclic terpene utilisation N-terminal domain-containing protein n=1 Tax=Cucurbitaria berberidis CBS 394.84 TaxID=1168544 RepID=A0A9P4GP06_9PLEO|nr:uncharacterized protein K460DRAFT_375570 [Cucurbitaria berberidis CBS 394.84]KAF1848791.1 hypothetical protein K460DRAFT_375570 [Cucurbitaria berberidis CBS 394.84]